MFLKKSVNIPKRTGLYSYELRFIYLKNRFIFFTEPVYIPKKNRFIFLNRTGLYSSTEPVYIPQQNRFLFLKRTGLYSYSIYPRAKMVEFSSEIFVLFPCGGIFNLLFINHTVIIGSVLVLTLSYPGI